MAQVDSLTRPPDDPYFDELLAQHRRIRRFLPRLVRTVGFGAMPAGQPVLKALQHLRKVEEGGVRGKTWPTEFVPKSWERHVIRNGIVDRHAWTLCLVDRLRGALRRRDVFAAPSLRFGDSVLVCSMALPGRLRGQPYAARWQNPRTRPKRLADCPTGSTTHSDRSPAICRRTPVSASSRTESESDT